MFDLSLVDLKKALARKEHFLRIPPEAAFHRYEDRYHEFPLMIHHCSESLAATIAAYRDLLTTWRSEEKDVVLVISLCSNRRRTGCFVVSLWPYPETSLIGCDDQSLFYWPPTGTHG